jgi:hypothetical protein
MKKIFKIAFFYLYIKIIIYVFSLFFSFPIFGLFKLEDFVSSDLSLNDMYYQIKESLNDNTDLATASGKIILINTGSIDSGNFRLNLSKVLIKINRFQPKVIAIDHSFKDSFPGTNELVNAINKHQKIVLSNKTDLKFEEHVKLGITDFPLERYTVRRYYSSANTFASLISQELIDSVYLPKNESFYINYLLNYQRFIQIDENANFFQLKDFVYVAEASNILKDESATMDFLRRNSSSCALLFGHLGYVNEGFDSKYDVEDKYPVPCDPNLIYRQKTMSGLMIHANALENLMDRKKQFFCVSDEDWFKVFEEFLLLGFLFILIFLNLGKLFNLIILFFLTFPSLYIVLYLMMYHFVFIEIGLTLLQLLFYEELLEFADYAYGKLKKVNFFNKLNKFQ